MAESILVYDPICGLTNSIAAAGGGMAMTIAEDGEMVHSMEGIPTWMAIAGVVSIILVSHLLVNWKKGALIGKNYRRFNLLQFPFLKALVKRKGFPLMLQSISLLAFLLVISAGLFGNQKTNIAPVLTWTWWWVLLVFLILGFGKAFCAMCPWEAMSSMITSLSLKSRIKQLGFERPWPKWARNILPAIGLFVVVTWFELGNDVTHSPSMTATMGLGMASMAVFGAMFFERRAFCRYGCLVGRISGLYALFSPVEIRPVSADACLSCKTKDCYRGNEESTGCPTSLFPGALKENTYCTMCTECVRSCPHDNMAINVRPFAADLFNKIRFKWDESILAIVLLALTSFHGVTMTPLWTQLNNWLRVQTGLGPSAIFTVLMALMLAAPILLFWVGAKAAHWLTPRGRVSPVKIFKAFSYSLVPVALFYHLAHNCMHFFLEGQNLLPLLSDPFGWGWDLFGTAGRTYGPILSLSSIWYLQIACIVIGHVYGVLIADRVARTLYRDPRDVMRGLTPLLLTMILYSSFSVWLIAQPMEMRSGM